MYTYVFLQHVERTQGAQTSRRQSARNERTDLLNYVFGKVITFFSCRA